MLLALQLNALLGDAPVLVEVPDVVGQTQAAGTAELEGDGFLVAVATAYSSVVAVGDIISQSPLAGAEVPEGSTVTITVSLGEEPQPEPAPAQTPAGSSRHRRRYYVEVDGQRFVVDDAEQARQILEQARALAERQAEQLADKVVRRLTKKRAVPRVRIDAPVVNVSPDIRADVAPLLADIERLYRQAAETAELRLLLARQAQADEDDDEELILLL